MNGWFLLFCGLNIRSVGIIATRVGLRSFFLLFAFLVLVLALAAPWIWGISRRTLAVHRACIAGTHAGAKNRFHRFCIRARFRKNLLFFRNWNSGTLGL